MSDRVALVSFARRVGGEPVVFVLDGWDVADGLEESLGVPPVHPAEGCEFDVVDGAPGCAGVDEFVLVEADDRFGHGVVVAVAP